MGATAIGTGLNSHPDYARLVTEKLRELSGIPVVGAEHLVEATQDAGAYVQLSGVLKRVATKLSKICNVLRLLSSGPRAGGFGPDMPPKHRNGPRRHPLLGYARRAGGDQEPRAESRIRGSRRA